MDCLSLSNIDCLSLSNMDCLSLSNMDCLSLSNMDCLSLSNMDCLLFGIVVFLQTRQMARRSRGLVVPVSLVSRTLARRRFSVSTLLMRTHEKLVSEITGSATVTPFLYFKGNSFIFSLTLKFLDIPRKIVH